MTTTTPTAPDLQQLREKLVETEAFIELNERRLREHEYDFLGASLKLLHYPRRPGLTEREVCLLAMALAVVTWRQDADRLRQQIEQAGEN